MQLGALRMRYRFHPDDHERYGEGGLYDEAALARVPNRQLIEIESTIGMSVREMMVRLRGDYVDATLAATWVVRKLSGVDEDFESYEPLATLIDWEPAPGDVDPPEQPASPSSSEA